MELKATRHFKMLPLEKWIWQQNFLTWPQQRCLCALAKSKWCVSMCEECFAGGDKPHLPKEIFARRETRTCWSPRGCEHSEEHLICGQGPAEATPFFPKKKKRKQALDNAAFATRCTKEVKRPMPAVDREGCSILFTEKRLAISLIRQQAWRNQMPAASFVKANRRQSCRRLSIFFIASELFRGFTTHLTGDWQKADLLKFIRAIARRAHRERLQRCWNWNFTNTKFILVCNFCQYRFCHW